MVFGRQRLKEFSLNFVAKKVVVVVGVGNCSNPSASMCQSSKLPAAPVDLMTLSVNSFCVLCFKVLDQGFLYCYSYKITD